MQRSGIIVILVTSILLEASLASANKVRRNQFGNYNVNAHAATSDTNSGRLTLQRAQCKAICMRRMIEHDPTMNEAQKMVALTSEKLMDTCLNKQSCAACERGCNAQLVREQVESTAPIVCPQQCKILPENLVKPCMDSCRLLSELMDDRRLADPLNPAPFVRNNQTARKCVVNFDCSSSQRCCKKQCGWCEQTVPFPTILDVNERENVDVAMSDSRQIGFDVEWTVPDNIPVDGPIVYVLDVRSYFGSGAVDDENAAPWRPVVMTTNKGAYLGGIRIGELYKFRLAAVSPDGTQGYSTPTQPRRSSIEPEAPSPPENLREEQRHVKSNGLIDVQFAWEPPAQSDVEVTKYKLFWFQKSDMGSNRVRASREVKKTIPASQVSFVLEDLLADAVHCFAVQALCDYNDRKLRSQRALICVNTSSEFLNSAGTTSGLTSTTPGYGDDSEEFDITQDYVDWDNENEENDNQIPTGDPEDYEIQGSTEPSRSSEDESQFNAPAPFTLLNGSLVEVFYENDLLHAEIGWSHLSNSPDIHKSAFKYTVIWRPLACNDVQGDNMRPQTTSTMVTDTQQAVLDGLRFSCQYQVVLRLLATNDVVGNETAFTFSTPRCFDVSVRDGRRPICAITTAPRVIFNQVIHAPKNVQVRLIESWTKQTWTKHYHAYVNWSASASDSVHSYRVIYGRKMIQNGPSAPRIEKGGAITKVVTTTYTSLLDLEADVTYVVQLQALSDFGDSRIVQVNFITSEQQAVLGNANVQVRQSSNGRVAKGRPTSDGFRSCYQLVTIMLALALSALFTRLHGSNN